MLHVNFKKCLTNKSGEYYEKWHQKEIAISDLKFNEKSIQCYFYDYKKTQIKVKLKANLLRLEFERAQRLQFGREQVEELIQQLRRIRTSNKFNFIEIRMKLFEFEPYQIDYLNELVKLSNGNTLKKFIEITNDRNYHLLEFLLLEPSFKLDFKKLKKNQEDTPLINILNSKKIQRKFDLILLLLARNYQIDEFEFDLFFKLTGHNEKTVFLRRVNHMKHRYNSIKSFSYEMEILILESIKKKEFVVFNYRKGDWMSFCHNIIENYKQIWIIAEEMMKQNGIIESVRLHRNYTKLYKKIQNAKYNRELGIKYELYEIITDVFSGELKGADIHHHIV